MMKNPVPINEELKDKADKLRETIQAKMKHHSTLFDENKTKENKDVDEMASILHDNTIEALTQIFPYTKTVTIKQQYITNEVWELVQDRQTKWKNILTLANTTKLSILLKHQKHLYSRQ